jgi:hypothetical protein
MLELIGLADFIEGPGDVAAAVVSEQTFDVDPLSAVPTQGPLEEPCGGLSPLVGQDLDVAEAAVVIDADVDELPAASVVSASAVSGDPMSNFAESPEFFGVEVQEFTRTVSLVANDLGLRVEMSESFQAQPFEHSGDRGTRHRQANGDPSRGEALTTS